MADYWKSTGKRYCDFCKCWTADNKASIDFHERGKNHQANVKKKLAEIKKKSIAKRKKDESSKKMFEQMEKAALVAVQKDIQSNSGGVGKSDMKNIVSAHSAGSSNSSSTYPWTAMTAPQGFTYYYNSLTGESSWTMPEVFKKLQEESDRDKDVQPIQSKKKKKNTVEVTKDPYRKKEEPPEEVHNIHPLLGGWSTVCRHEEEEEEEKDKSTTTTTIEANADNKDIQGSSEGGENDNNEQKTGKKFKEKVMKSNLVSTDDPVVFKKRKSKNRNVRKRDEE